MTGRARKKSKFVCAKCGLSVGMWFYGWKHQASWGSGKSCGQKPVPVERPATQEGDK